MGQFASTDNIRSLIHVALPDVRKRIAEDDRRDPITTELLVQEEALYKEVLEAAERLEAEEEELAQAREERRDQTDERDAQPLTLEAKIKSRLRELYQWILKRGGFESSFYFYDVDKNYEAILQTGMPLPEVLRRLDVIIAEHKRGEGHR